MGGGGGGKPREKAAGRFEGVQKKTFLSNDFTPLVHIRIYITMTPLLIPWRVHRRVLDVPSPENQQYVREKINLPRETQRNDTSIVIESLESFEIVYNTHHATKTKVRQYENTFCCNYTRYNLAFSLRRMYFGVLTSPYRSYENLNVRNQLEIMRYHLK